jgi:predicted alpha/beta hydrolase family esterase
MKYIFFPGNSIGNKEWIDRLAYEFEDPKEVVHYSHWDRGEKSINFDEELKKINISPAEECTVVAKSIGCILALKAMEQRRFNPKEFYFIGFPLFYVNNHDIKSKGLLKIGKPITFIQKTEDPQASYKQLKEEVEYIKGDANFIKYELDDEPIDNHHYDNTAYLKQIIASV